MTAFLPLPNVCGHGFAEHVDEPGEPYVPRGRQSMMSEPSAPVFGSTDGPVVAPLPPST
ncbi:hypothetical protein [Amycolatopsis sp. cg9]|uniref:hypothetical protein n=1 Tax=Amycolatopsis sp. cg9 TaxID=3238801 RepID=UPI00352362B3